MSRLAWCAKCRATYPLAIVAGDGLKGAKDRALTCPLGHTGPKVVRPLEDEPKGDKKD